MKSRIFPLLLIFIIGSFGALGLFGLGFMEHSEHHSCPIAAMSGGNCPPAYNALALTIHHISGLQGLTRGIVGFNINFLAVSILLIIAVSLIAKIFAQTFFSSEQGFYQTYSLVEKLPSQITQFLFWVALHNKRAPYLSLWVV